MPMNIYFFGYILRIHKRRKLNRNKVNSKRLFRLFETYTTRFFELFIVFVRSSVIKVNIINIILTRHHQVTYQ